MSFVTKYLNRFQKKQSASVAKERLQIIIAHERSQKIDTSYLKDLQSEIVTVIAKYIQIDEEQVKVQLAQQGQQSVLELNIALPEGAKLKPRTQPSNQKNTSTAKTPTKKKKATEKA